LTIASPSLSVQPFGEVALGVTAPQAGDAVTVSITGLPRYETISDNLDQQRFRGSSISLTAAEVNSGLMLHSHYRGSGSPTATLTIQATDSTTSLSSPRQTITVTDPPITSSSGATSSSGGTHRNHAGSSLPQLLSDFNHPDFQQLATTLGGGDVAKIGSALHAWPVTDSTASASAKRFALLSQILAADSANASSFGQVAATPAALAEQLTQFLTKSHH
jgi:hypothetical protein